jgi:protein-tyrosine phosphatase
MVEYLQGINIPFDEHESKPLDETIVVWSDIILTMEKSHRDQIIAFWPQEKNKVHLLSEYLSSDQHEDDISDPYGLSPYFYRVAVSHISLAVENIVQRILSNRPIV